MIKNEYTKTLLLSPVYPGEPLSEILHRENVDIHFPCGGNHTCGKCKVVVEGELSEISPSENALLSEEDRKNGIRLACFVRAMGDVKIHLSKALSSQILTHGTVTLTTNEPLMASGHFGVAVDIGTTTVVCKLYDSLGTELAVSSELNRQKQFGADVISRINYGMLHNNEVISRSIVEQIEEMLQVVSDKANILRNQITHAVVTGNTTMLHFFSGLDPKSIGFAPFTPVSLFNTYHTDILSGIEVYIPPCVSAYVGADLVCCILSSNMMEKKDKALIVDIGTNGEMALLSDGDLHCCSTAAGPAFEGAGISHGSVASTGAISHVNYDAQTGLVMYETIEDAPPKGICGSGVVDAIAMLYDTGAMLPNGRLEIDGNPLAAMMQENDEVEFVFPDTSIAITQGDIRKIQLAKAAIYAGIITLSEACEISTDELDVIYLCGGFGSFINLSAAETIGLIPKDSKSRTVALGNAALMGASMLLLDSTARNKIRRISDECQYIELSGHDGFMDNYVDSMMFWDLDID
ncbi:DUF4445 domain-containing protein [Tissierella creatinini]|nr:DUF4445 domain-containing protein [Tissierella creatinini]TJX63704.1 DUF4445 domain-containing protein [Soehngenia saccharolytica]